MRQGKKTLSDTPPIHFMDHLTSESKKVSSKNATFHTLLPAGPTNARFTGFFCKHTKVVQGRQQFCLPIEPQPALLK